MSVTSAPPGWIVIRWVLVGLHVPLAILPILYWRHRDLDPIKSRRPLLMTVICASAVLLALQQLIRMAAVDWLPIWWDVFAPGVWLICFIDGHLLFAVSLYIAFNKTRDQLQFIQTLEPCRDIAFNKTRDKLQLIQTLEPQLAVQLRRVIRVQKFLISDRFATYWLVSQSVLFCAFCTIYCAVTDFSALSLPLYNVDIQSNNPFPLIQYFVFIRLLLCIIFVVLIRNRIGLVQDAFGSKTMLQHTSLIMAAGCIVYLAMSTFFLDLGLPQLSVAFLMDAVLLHSFVVPIRKCRKAAVSVGCAISDFEAFLLDADGFAEFQHHLEKEFAVENLLFWRAVRQYRAEFPNRATESATDIYKRFLAPEAALEVNIPSEMSKQLRACFITDDGGGVVLADAEMLRRDLFDAASRQTLALMESDPLVRFVLTRPPALERFLFHRAANQMMSSNRTPVQGTTRMSASLTLHSFLAST